MKLRYHLLLKVCITAVLVCLSIGSHAIAQSFGIPGGPPPGYYMQPPSMAPRGPSMYPGVFYISGGAKVRDLQSLSIGTKSAELTNIIVQGSPAFGPNVPGFIVYPVPPTALGTDDPSVSGIWSYDDGFIEPTGTPSAILSVNYPSGALEGIGHTSANEDVGSFRIFDFHVQANDQGTGSISSTTTLSWSKMLTGLTPASTDFLLHAYCADGVTTGTSCFPGLACPGTVACSYTSISGAVNGFTQTAATSVAGSTTYYTETPSGGFTAFPGGGAATDFQNRVWAPYIEIGFQSAALFDVFYGLSAFQVSRTFSETRPTVVPFARRAFRDTFGFRSGDPATWSVINFWSISDSTDQLCSIFPNNGSGQPIPTRTFFTAIDPNVPATPAQETITGRLDFTTIESRSGGRAWVPLWGLGRLGTSFGGLLAATPQTLTTNAIYVATADSPPLLPGDPPLRVAGDVLLNISTKQDSLAWNLGLFCGADLELGFRRLFVKSAIEYNYYFYAATAESEVIATKVNLSGAAATFSAGARF